MNSLLIRNRSQFKYFEYIINEFNEIRKRPQRKFIQELYLFFAVSKEVLVRLSFLEKLV